MFLMYKLYHIFFTVSIGLLKFNSFVKYAENKKFPKRVCKALDNG